MRPGTFLLIFAAWNSVAYSQGRAPSPPKLITEADCTAAKLGTEIPTASIGERVSAVTLNAPQWRAATDNSVAFCSVEGAISPVDKAAPQIRFGVALPASWAHRAAQLGGGGMNGSIPRLAGGVGRGAPLLQQGFATYGSDSGHQAGGFGPPPGGGRGTPGRGPGGFPPPNPAANEWALNSEAIANLGYLQLKKTHDAAMVLIHPASTTSSVDLREAVRP
jgi:hypothetical protein